MARVSFYLIKENADGNITLDRNINTSDLTATKNGSPFSTTFYANGDGTYYFSQSGSGVYSVFLNGLVQDEFRDIYISDDDSLLTTNVDGTTVEINGDGNVSVINGSSVLRESDVHDNLVSTSSVQPLSANQGYELSASMALKNDTDSTILFETDVIGDFSTGGIYAPQSAQSLAIDFKGTNYLETVKTYNAAIRELDRKIGLLRTGGGFISLLAVGYAPAFTEGSATVNMRGVNGTDSGYGYRMIRDTNLVGLSIIANISAYSKNGGAVDYTLRATLYINGILQDEYVEFTIDGTGTYSASTIALSQAISAGSLVLVKMSKEPSAGDDTFSINNTSVLLELES